MADIVLRPRQRLAAGKPKPDITVSAETFEAMKANGLIDRFIVVSTGAHVKSKSMDAIRKATEAITVKFTEGAKPKTEPYSVMMDNYRAFVKAGELAKAKEVLIKADKLYPDNSYIQKQLKLKKYD